MPHLLRRALAAITVLAATIGLLALINGPATPAARSVPTSTPAVGPTTDERIRALEPEARDGRHAKQARVALANLYLQKARETSDGAWHTKAQALLDRALQADPEDPQALTAMGNLRLVYHQFADGLAYGRRAQRQAPGTVAPYPVIVDALIELGRYQEAGEALQEMVDLKPSLPAYARVSYYRELHGDLRGAIEAMRLAVSAGGAVSENAASVRTLLGELYFSRGDLLAARRAHRQTLHSTPGYGPAIAGLARIDAARGRLGQAARRYREAYKRAPKPEYAIALAETLEAAGQAEASRRQFAFSRRLLQQEAQLGTMNANELALIEADHFDRRRGVQLAREAYAKAPSVVSADALSWALTRAGAPRAGLRWARRALSIGSRFPRFLVHAGLTAEAAGRPALARRWLRRSLADNRNFHPVWAPIAQRALRRL
jgi:tetratricopeptide (TPR) repeat protein